MASSPAPDDQRERDRSGGGFLSSRRGKVIATALAVLLIAVAGFAVTLAALTDDVTAAQINVTGGTLDLVANQDTDDSDVGWAGQVAMETGVFTPGEERTATMELVNEGDVPFTVAMTTTGTDPDSCFGYVLEDTTRDVALLGTAAGSDAGTISLGTANTAVALLDGVDDPVWEPGDTKNYQLTVRMLESCSTNAATGSLDMSLVASQVVT